MRYSFSWRRQLLHDWFDRKARNLYIPTVFNTLVGATRWNFAKMFSSGKTRMTGLPYVEESMMTCSAVSIQYSLVPSVLHLSHGFQCSPTLNCQPYEGRLPLTSRWKKSSNMTVDQSSLISLTHHCYNSHPGSHCGWTCNQLTSKVDRGINGSRLRWSILT